MSPYDETLAQLELFSLPAVLVYDQQGKLLDRIEGDVDYERDIIPLIEAASKE
jgi:thiol:disulfide interchange protein